ncbi:hypothetical protein [Actinoplanes sp. NPDC051411]|uniref:hypothetical protein n=1 Tax=Actinoplanes sp. NPDC051411 TaxID=3155522 RepID=UPI0034336E17
MTVAVGYMAGGLGSAIVLVNAGNRSLLLLAALPAVLQSIEMAVRWATGASADRDDNDEVHPSPKQRALD